MVWKGGPTQSQNLTYLRLSSLWAPQTTVTGVAVCERWWYCSSNDLVTCTWLGFLCHWLQYTGFLLGQVLHQGWWVCRKMMLRYCHVCKQYYLCGNTYSVTVPLHILLYEHPLNITLQNISIKMGKLGQMAGWRERCYWSVRRTQYNHLHSITERLIMCLFQKNGDISVERCTSVQSTHFPQMCSQISKSNCPWHFIAGTNLCLER